MRRCDECFKRAAVRVEKGLAVKWFNTVRGTDEDKPKYNNITGTYLSFLLTIQNNGL